MAAKLGKKDTVTVVKTVEKTAYWGAEMAQYGAEMALSATYSARFSPVFRHISANVTFQKIANHR